MPKIPKLKRYSIRNLEVADCRSIEGFVHARNTKEAVAIAPSHFSVGRIRSYGLVRELEKDEPTYEGKGIMAQVGSYGWINLKYAHLRSEVMCWPDLQAAIRRIFYTEQGYVSVVDKQPAEGDKVDIDFYGCPWTVSYTQGGWVVPNEKKPLPLIEFQWWKPTKAN